MSEIIARHERPAPDRSNQEAVTAALIVAAEERGPLTHARIEMPRSRNMKPAILNDIELHGILPLQEILCRARSREIPKKVPGTAFRRSISRRRRGSVAGR
jgi:hypothetical protein